MAIFELVGGGRSQIIALNRTMKAHRIAIQKGIAAALTKTRFRAEEHIIKSTARFKSGNIMYNPRWARAQQPTTPGRLTSRTGKLKYMLRNMVSMGNPLRGWVGFGKTLAKQKSIAFLSQVRAIKTALGYESYVGTIRVYISGHPTLFETTRGQPQESLKTLAVRFQWEYGIRGERRPIFAPVRRQTDFDMRKLVEQKNNLIWRI